MRSRRNARINSYLFGGPFKGCPMVQVSTNFQEFNARDDARRLTSRVGDLSLQDRRLARMRSERYYDERVTERCLDGLGSGSRERETEC